MARKTKYSWAGLVLMLLVCSLCKVTAAGSRLRIGADGGYSDVLVKISANTDQKYCRRILSNLQVTAVFSDSVLSSFLCHYSFISINKSFFIGF